MSNVFCTQCGASVKSDSTFCTACGAKIARQRDISNQPPASAEAYGISNKPISTAGEVVGSTTLASSAGGEMIFHQTLPFMGGMMSRVDLGPFKYLLGGFSRVLRGIKGAFKDKKNITLVILLSFIWLILMVLPALGVNASGLRYLSFLTCAQCGTTGGIFGMIGGIIGKGFFAFFISAVLMSSNGNPGLGSGLKSFFGCFKVNEKENAVLLLSGVGLALIGYNFLTGNASLQNSMIGIMAFFLSLRALNHKAGFLRGFFLALFKKYRKKTIPDISSINPVIAGWTAGFPLGIILSFSGISIIGYLAGLLLLLAALILGMTSNREKEVIAG